MVHFVLKFLENWDSDFCEPDSETLLDLSNFQTNRPSLAIINLFKQKIFLTFLQLTDFCTIYVENYLSCKFETEKICT